jgi:uncharacterized protein YbbC (DUF1343 family)
MIWFRSHLLHLFALSALFTTGCGGAPNPSARSAPAKPAPQIASGELLLGIDVLERQRFAALAGKRVGLLTHPAGVNRRGESTVDVLRRAPQVNLVALFGPEHGIYGNEKADQPIDDQIDARTGLPVFSLYGRYRKPTPTMLRGIDALVIDLQDIGSRSYTYISAMRLAMEACFERNVEVIVLDRPNPLGGLKVSGPGLDREWLSYVGAFRVPYVHGLTIGELARMAASEPGVLQIPDEVRRRGRLTVVPMSGWRRSTTWPETGLTWVPTSPNIPDFASTVGYAMTGLGAQLGGFRHGIGTPHPFRLLTFRNQSLDVVERELAAANLQGLTFRRIPGPNGQPLGLYVEVTDWDQWRPTELSFHMMRIACRLNPPNPFAQVPESQASLFNKHVGSTAWWNALVAQGPRINVNAFVESWEQQAQQFQHSSRRFWLYAP